MQNAKNNLQEFGAFNIWFLILVRGGGVDKHFCIHFHPHTKRLGFEF